ncbi:hypothetical protein EYR41_010433 [Orbilia oligospora]|uniref:Uncharacterized protein n=1 Tax=Orbilia oligospora TaxID=2813651 RepID=A0A7C8TX28_ORBOL|nr:hypothetical protein TWF751_000080 [Orbilia oligospora]TGJ64372.1 hypothetical protein EYR41_010433 [Orbilia oligospora]
MVSALYKNYAFITVVDVNEGDCYVVDLYQGDNKKASGHPDPKPDPPGIEIEPDPESNDSNPGDPRYWNRFAIDFGPESGGRKGIITEAIFEEPPQEMDPWSETRNKGGEWGQGPNIPPLCGIVLTHSDQDHWGNIEGVIANLRKITVDEDGANVPRHALSNTAIDLCLSPQKDWALEMWKNLGGDTSYVDYEELTNPSGSTVGLRCKFKPFYKRVTDFDASKTFYDVKMMAQQAGCDIQYRCNLVGKSFDFDYYKKNYWNRAIPDQDLPKGHQEWTEVDTHMFPIQKLFKPNDFKGIREAFVLVSVLLEVRLVLPDDTNQGPWPREVKWTPNFMSSIEGNWLRAMAKIKVTNPFINQLTQSTVRMPPPLLQAPVSLKNPFEFHRFQGEKDPRILQDLNKDLIDIGKFISAATAKDPFAEEFLEDFYIGEPDTEQHTLLPTALVFQPVIVGWNDRPYYMRFYNEKGKLTRKLPWSRSFYGCASREYVQDFAYMVLQRFLSTNSGGGVGKSKEHSRWSEYANRASIISYFTYDAESFLTDDPGSFVIKSDGTQPPRKPGQFDMLFTGDAFELDKVETQAYNRQKANIKLNDKSPSYPDFPMTPPDGNILNWLWRQNRLQATRVGVLKVPHHGSSITTGATFFRMVTASVYLISAGTKHGHPRAETIETILKAVIQEDGKAEVPENFNSKATNPLNNEISQGLRVRSINERRRPRLIFLTHQSLDQEIRDLGKGDIYDPKSRDFIPWYQYLKHHCPFVGNKKIKSVTEHRANVKFLYQRHINGLGYLRFGTDHNRQDELRVEWDKDQWEELRFDLDFDAQGNPIPLTEREDPIAYPSPGSHPDWELPADSTVIAT